MRLTWRRYLGRRVRLQTPERAVEGVLAVVGPELLVLRGAEVPQPEGSAPVPLDGELVLERRRVVWAEIL